MNFNLTQYMLPLFLAGSTLAALASNTSNDPLSDTTGSDVNVSTTSATQDLSESVIDCLQINTLMGSRIASIMPNFYQLAILSSAGSKGRQFVYEMMGIELPFHLLSSRKRKDPLPSNNFDNNTQTHLTFLDGMTTIYIDYTAALDFEPVRGLSKLLVLKDRGTPISLVVNNSENETTIRADFLAGCTGLTSLDLSPLSNVRSIANSFLVGCTGLTTLDLSPLSQVTNIAHAFLVDCTGLTKLDLSPLSQVTKIGHDFLDGCTGLTTLDLSPLSQVKDIGERFLEGCTGLTDVDLSPVSNAIQK